MWMKHGGYAGARVPKLANRCFWVTTSPGSANLLRLHDTREGEAAHLATLAHSRKALLPRYV